MVHRARYRETITLTPKTGEGAYGPVFGSPQEIKGYVEPGFRRIVNGQGIEVTASAYIELGPEHDSQIHVGDKAAWDGNEYVVLAVQPIRRRGQTDHLEVYCGPQGVSG